MSPSLVFSTTLPVKPSQTIDVGDPAVNLAPLDVADEIQWRRLQQPVRLPRQLVALGLFFADGEQADAGLLDAECDARVDAAHDGELKQVLRPALDVGAGIEQHRGPAARGNGRRKRWTIDAGNRAERGVGRHHRGAGVTGTEQRYGLPSGHEVGGHPDGRARLPRRTDAGASVISMTSGASTTSMPRPGQSACADSACFDDGRVADERKPYGQMPRGRHRASTTAEGA